MLSADINAPGMSLVSSRQASLCALGILLITLLTHLLIWKTANIGFSGDENRYLAQAEHLLHGEPLYTNDVIKNPPLFPAIIASLQLLGVSDENLKLLNILSMAAATLTLLSILYQFCSPVWAVFLTGLFIFYPPLLMLGSQLLSEPIACLLVLLVVKILFETRGDSKPSLASLCLLAIVLALLALMKPLMGYALAVAVVGSYCFALCNGANLARRSYGLWLGKSSLVAILICSPYLFHVHSITGSYFSWGTTGGEHLYWMSINDEDVWGSWVPEDKTQSIDFLVDGGFAEEVRIGERMSGPEANLYYRNLAQQRILENPSGFLQNIVANAGRVLFNYPFSFRPQSLFTFAYLLPNVALYLSFALSLLLLPITAKHQHMGLSFSMALCLVYLGGNILVGSSGRQGVLLVAPLLVWLAWQVKALIDIGLLNPKARPDRPADT